MRKLVMRDGEEEEEEESGSKAELYGWLNRILSPFSTPPCDQTLHDVFIDKNSFLHVSKTRQECWTRQFLQGSGIPNDRGALTKKKKS